MTALILSHSSRKPRHGFRDGIAIPCRQPGEIAAGARRFVILLLFGAMCAVSSIAFLLSLGIAMPVLTEQFASWLKSGHWEPVPLAMVLARMGYVPSVDASLIRTIIDWVLSFETGFAIVAAASAFGCAVWRFERARP